MDQTTTIRRTALYPPIEPFETGMIDLDSRHRMYFEVSGKADGVPVVFLHGGPGAGTHAHHRRYFDPRHYRIVLFDQRGAGRSEPFGELADNTTAHLVADMETLRRYLGVERWLLFGGSWGSTLALAYAESHPDRVIGMVLRGIFLARAFEVDWFLHGMRAFFPEAWDRFAGFLPPEERGDLLTGYHRRLADPDPEVHMPAARVWSTYEGACSTLRHDPDIEAEFGASRTALGLARLEAHYFVNRLFMAENQLIDNIGMVSGIPATVVQGRYDVVCPIRSADELVRHWPGEPGANGLDYRVIADSGHAASEPGTRAALIAATERYKALIP
ncbi:MAG: prolyl aminopeptidase [Alphaproteobacteria bacterium]|nr:prolyl aminopeptidase [Alphaproteobacteria bacterium]